MGRKEHSTAGIDRVRFPPRLQRLCKCDYLAWMSTSPLLGHFPSCDPRPPRDGALVAIASSLGQLSATGARSCSAWLVIGSRVFKFLFRSRQQPPYVHVCAGANRFMVVGVWPRAFDGYVQWERFHFQTDVSHKQLCIVARFPFCSPRLLLKSGLYVYARRLSLLGKNIHHPHHLKTN